MSFRKPCMEDLPQPIMADILSRLPTKMIIRYKCVCKQWQNIVFDSYLADLQLSRSPVRFTIYYKSKPGILKWVEIEDELDHRNLHHDPVMSLNFKVAPIIQLVGSVNGLVCMWQVNKNTDNTYICNPITREYMILPLPRQQYYREGRPSDAAYCFGLGSLTRAYKVIRILQRDIVFEDSTPTYRVSDVEVYTLGTGQWRSLSHVPYSLQGIYGTFLNGHAHWNISHEKICAFDFDNETFELFPSPPSERRVYRQRLGVLKGCLCRCDNSYFKFTIWVMKEYGINKSWHKELVIKKGINPTLDILVLEPPCLIGGFKDGTILMSSSKGTILVYSPSSATIIDTNIFDGYFNGFTYRPSFYRLHNLENERVQMI